MTRTNRGCAKYLVAAMLALACCREKPNDAARIATAPAQASVDVVMQMTPDGGGDASAPVPLVGDAARGVDGGDNAASKPSVAPTNAADTARLSGCCKRFGAMAQAGGAHNCEGCGGEGVGAGDLAWACDQIVKSMKKSEPVPLDDEQWGGIHVLLDDKKISRSCRETMLKFERR